MVHSSVCEMAPCRDCQRPTEYCALPMKALALDVRARFEGDSRLQATDMLHEPWALQHIQPIDHYCSWGHTGLVHDCLGVIVWSLLVPWDLWPAFLCCVGA